MTYENPGTGSLDYFPCRYGDSRLVFRGPKRRLIDPYALFLGGTKTYGKFIEHPFPDLLEEQLGFRMVNMAFVNAGVDVFLSDTILTEAARDARVTVVQVIGAHNLSNRYYKVHPRRNDRFISASAIMQQAFREIDFTEFSFTRHMLSTLQQRCPGRFEMLVEELQAIWVERMKVLLGRIGSPTCLLWLASRRPDDPPSIDEMVSHDPLFVTGEMLTQLVPRIDEYIEVIEDGLDDPDEPEGKIYSELEAPAAELMPGVSFHAKVAQKLGPVLSRLAETDVARA